jgi:hypothetical protein
MKARILTIATLTATFVSVLPAVDQNLLNLVMPDANVLAGVNVVSAKNSPFGQYVLSQLAPKDQEFQKMAVLTGFDPRQDLIELLAASTGAAGGHSGLALATGTFNTSAIMNAATAAGAITETYHGATIIEDPKAKEASGIAFLGSTIAVAGDLADVKAAIDRQSAPSTINSSLASQAKSLSASQDAWVASIIGLPPIQAPAGVTGGKGGSMLPANALQQIVGGNAGVKFGTNVVVTAQAQADNAQDATNLAGMLQLLANMAKMQSNNNPQITALADGLTVSASGTTVNITFTLPQEQLQQLMSHPNTLKKPAAAAPKK